MLKSDRSAELCDTEMGFPHDGDMRMCRQFLVAPCCNGESGDCVHFIQVSAARAAVVSPPFPLPSRQISTG